MRAGAARPHTPTQTRRSFKICYYTGGKGENLGGPAVLQTSRLAGNRVSCDAKLIRIALRLAVRQAILSARERERKGSYAITSCACWRRAARRSCVCSVV